jgi:hypothetical protein
LAQAQACCFVSQQADDKSWYINPPNECMSYKSS